MYFQNKILLSKRQDTHTIKLLYHMKTGLEIMAGHQTVPGLDAWLMILLLKLFFCHSPKWMHSIVFHYTYTVARIYLASNLDKQPRNYYFQPCENTMYKMVRESGKKTLWPKREPATNLTNKNEVHQGQIKTAPHWKEASTLTTAIPAPHKQGW